MRSRSAPLTALSSLLQRNLVRLRIDPHSIQSAVYPTEPPDPVALAAGVGVGLSSSVIPYVLDQLAMARLPRGTYALFVALLPATATVIGVFVLHQLPSLTDLAGICLVMVGVGLHRPDPARNG